MSPCFQGKGSPVDAPPLPPPPALEVTWQWFPHTWMDPCDLCLRAASRCRTKLSHTPYTLRSGAGQACWEPVLQQQPVTTAGWEC